MFFFDLIYKAEQTRYLETDTCARWWQVLHFHLPELQLSVSCIVLAGVGWQDVLGMICQCCSKPDRKLKVPLLSFLHKDGVISLPHSQVRNMFYISEFLLCRKDRKSQTFQFISFGTALVLVCLQSRQLFLLGNDFLCATLSPQNILPHFFELSSSSVSFCLGVLFIHMWSCDEKRSTEKKWQIIEISITFLMYGCIHTCFHNTTYKGVTLDFHSQTNQFSKFVGYNSTCMSLECQWLNK